MQFAKDNMPRLVRANPDWENGTGASVTFVAGFFEESLPIVLAYSIPDMVLKKPAPGGFFFSGAQDFLKRDPREYVVINGNDEIDVPLTIEKMITLQSTITPNRVGGSTDIIHLTADGAQWIQRKPECRERE